MKECKEYHLLFNQISQMLTFYYIFLILVCVSFNYVKTAEMLVLYPLILWRVGVPPLSLNTLMCIFKSKDPEEGMATHSSIPAWRSPWTEEPGGLQSLGSRHNWSALAGMHEVQWLGQGTFTAFSHLHFTPISPL